MVAVFAVAIIVDGSAKQDAGTKVSPWVWPIAGVLLVAAVAIFLRMAPVVECLEAAAEA